MGMWRFLVGLLLVLAFPLSALADGQGENVPWHATWMLEAVGVAVAIAAVVALWIIRKLISGLTYILIVVLAVGLILVAVFGREIGIYDAVLGTEYRSEDSFWLGPPPTDDGQPVLPPEDLEPYDPNAPSFDEFFRRLGE